MEQTKDQVFGLRLQHLKRTFSHLWGRINGWKSVSMRPQSAPTPTRQQAPPQETPVPPPSFTRFPPAGRQDRRDSVRLHCSAEPSGRPEQTELGGSKSSITSTRILSEHLQQQYCWHRPPTCQSGTGVLTQETESPPPECVFMMKIKAIIYFNLWRNVY